MKTLRFGIEIETVGLSQEQLARAIHTALGATVATESARDGWRITDSGGRIWRVVPDGSLSGGTYSGEIVSPILGYDDIEALQNIPNPRLRRHRGPAEHRPGGANRRREG